MCSAATCRKCGRATWRGCGQHVNQVMAGIPKNERCVCGVAKKPGSTAKGKRPVAVPEPAPKRGLLASLFRR